MASEIRKASEQASSMTEAIKKIELQRAEEQLGALSDVVPAVLVARGQIHLNHAQAMAALEKTAEALRFIAGMTVTIIEGDNTKVSTEPVSRYEARVGLANMARAIEENIGK